MGTRLERVSKDALLAAVVGFVTLGVTLPWAHTQEGRASIDVLAVLLLVAAPAALLMRRRAPVAVLVLTTLPALA